MKIFFDTEFTDLVGIVYGIQLISAGFVAENGDEHYFELPENYTRQDCSPFVIEAVLPHLDRAQFAKKNVRAAEDFKDWVESFEVEVHLICDSPNYDWQLLAEFLEEQQAWPGNLMRETSVSRLFNHYQAIENYFAYQPMAIRHHALWDARALVWAWRQGEPK